MKSWMRLLAAAGPILACETPKSVAVPASSPAASSAAPQVIAASPEAGAAARPPRVRVESPFPGGVEIINDTDAPVGILRALPIERQDGTTWAPTHNLDMKPTCDAAPLPDCVSIPAHTRHAPLPWTGWLGCTQCGTCRANAPAQIGTYRVVAVECASGVRHEGPPMAVVGEGRFAGAPRVSSPADHPDTVQIANDSEVPMSFSSRVEVLVLDKKRGAWDSAVGAAMTLASTCGDDAGACVIVPGHGRVTSMPHRAGCAPCSKCSAASSRPGTYMFRVSVCSGTKPLYNEVYGYNFYTEPFTVGPGGTVKRGE